MDLQVLETGGVERVPDDSASADDAVYLIAAAMDRLG
jgi:hypothetical protein